MNHETIWEHSVQTIPSPPRGMGWPVFFNLHMAEDFARELKKVGVNVTAIISRPVTVINALGGEC